MKFSVLMSVYKKEKPQYLDECLFSIVNNTVLPTEIIVMKDGKLTQELDEVLERYNRNYPALFWIYGNDENRGLGYTLAEGLNKCHFDYIARMDTDDICLKDRFQKQVAFIQKHPEVDIVGGQIIEFDAKTRLDRSRRIVPTTDEDIRKYAKTRCPFNHMTVMFKKKAVLKAGNYMPYYRKEDYYLWARMICNKAITANIDDDLVRMRVDDGMYKRRGGLKYVIQDLHLQKQLLRLNIIGIPRMIFNMIIRIGGGLMPNSLRKYFYLRGLKLSKPIVNEQKVLGIEKVVK